jgi:prepilin-type N-terminal cleavage/methylation domain-containing protein
MTGRQSGFSLIEALVAIAIVGLALVPLLHLQTQLARRAHVQHAMALEATATHSTLALLADLNPMTQRQGEIETGSLRLRWRARPVTGAVRSTRAGQGEVAFLVQLFEVTVSAHDLDGTPITQFAFERVGWRRVDLPRE